MRFPVLFSVALLGISACASVPDDVNPAIREMGPIGQPPPGVNTVSGGQISATDSDLPTGAGATGNVTFLDPNNLANVAAAAIDEAEAGASTGGGGVFDNIQPQTAADVRPPPLIPRVAAFAIRTSHQPGQRQWRRNPLRRDGQAICNQFPTRDEAQDRFLADGGPERDPNGMDPDGDGFVCGFDPSALRAEAAAPAASPFETLPPITE